MASFLFETKSSRGDKLLGATNTETDDTYYFVKLEIGKITYIPTDIGASDSSGFQEAIEAIKENGYRVHIEVDAHEDAIRP